MIFFSMILTNNYVLVQVPGHLPVPGRFQKAGFLQSACRRRRHLRHELASLATHAYLTSLHPDLLELSKLGYLSNHCLHSGHRRAGAARSRSVLKKYHARRCTRRWASTCPLITTNCCVLGVTILAVQDYSAVVTEFGFGMAYAEALVCAAGAGVGFLVAMLLFCGVRQRVEASNPPESFKGLPITLVSAAITSLSFMGFGGLVENIINAIL